MPRSKRQIPNRIYAGAAALVAVVVVAVVVLVVTAGGPTAKFPFSSLGGPGISGTSTAPVTADSSGTSGEGTAAQRSYLELAMVGVEKTSEWWDGSAGWFYDQLGSNPNRAQVTLWGSNGMFEALDEIAIADPTTKTKAAVETFARGEERYWNPNLKPVPRYSPHAAATFAFGPLEQVELDTWRQIQAVNVESALLLTQAFAPGMLTVHAVIEGRLWLWLDDPRSALELAPGDVALVRGGPDHFIAHKPGAACRGPEQFLARHRDDLADGANVFLCGAYILSGDVGRGLLEALPPTLTLSAAADDPLHDVIGLVSSELASSAPGQQTVLDRLLDVLLVLAIRACFQRSENAPRWYQAAADPRPAPALSAMHADAAHAWTVPELAALSGLSRAAFARIFQLALDQAPMQYLTEWRMTLARDDLRAGELSLSLVGARTGYASPYAFAAAFRRHHGVPPGPMAQTGDRGPTSQAAGRRPDPWRLIGVNDRTPAYAAGSSAAGGRVVSQCAIVVSASAEAAR